MKFKIIPNEQTPKIEYVDMPKNLIENRIQFHLKLLEKFVAFARLQHNCAGLAANQVSCDGKRIIMQPFFAIKTNNHWDLIIHPNILNYYGKGEYKIEGCLTWLGKKIKAMRHQTIKVSYYNLKGEKIIDTISGFQAQVWQHEYDHLMGVEEKII